MTNSQNSKSPSQKKRVRLRRRENSAEIIRENVKAAGGGWQEAEDVSAGLVKLEKEERSGQAKSRQVRRQYERAREKLEGRRLRLMEQDDAHRIQGNKSGAKDPRLC